MPIHYLLYKFLQIFFRPLCAFLFCSLSFYIIPDLSASFCSVRVNPCCISVDGLDFAEKTDIINLRERRETSPKDRATAKK